MIVFKDIINGRLISTWTVHKGRNTCTFLNLVVDDVPMPITTM